MESEMKVSLTMSAASGDKSLSVLQCSDSNVLLASTLPVTFQMVDSQSIFDISSGASNPLQSTTSGEIDFDSFHLTESDIDWLLEEMEKPEYGLAEQPFDSSLLLVPNSLDSHFGQTNQYSQEISGDVSRLICILFLNFELPPILLHS